MDNTTEDNVLDIDQTNEEVLSTEESAEHTDAGEGNDNDEELRKLRSENAKLVEIIKRRKERESHVQQETSPEKKSITNSSQLTRDEALLIAQGYSEDDLEQLQLVSRGANVSLKEAKEHPLFISYLEKQEADKKSKKATMGASKGSAMKKTVDIGAMSEEDHKKAWLSSVGMNQ